MSNITGLLLFCGCFPRSRRFLESAFPYTAFGYYTGDLVAFSSLLLGMITAPAIVSATAKESYALWGILPLPFFFVWLVVSHVVVGSACDFNNLLLGLAFCWVVASCPVSLIRNRRQRRPKQVKPVFVSMSLSIRQRCVTHIAVLAPATALIILGWYNLKHPLHFSLDMQAHWPSGKEAHIPLIERGSKLYVKAWLNDKEELCRVDTGADTVEWPRGLHVEGRLTSRHGQSLDPLGGVVNTQTIVLPHLRIGEYELMNLPTEMSDISSYLFLPPQWPDADEGVNLGNPAFVMTVLTIDYKNAAMIIRPPQYDFMQQHRKVGDRVLQMGWTADGSAKDEESRFYGWPAVRVAIAGTSFWCTLDTGWDGPELGLTDDFVKHHPSVRQTKRDLAPFDAMHGSAQVERLHNLDVTVPCLWPPHVNPISLQVNGLVTSTLYGGEGAIGLALMERYRVTIDYGRRRVLLEPYAQDERGQKQEKRLPKPKQAGI